MTVNNFIEFKNFAIKHNFTDLESFHAVSQSYLTICNCKPTLKALYHKKSIYYYTEFLKKHSSQIKTKISSLENEDIIIFKQDSQILLSLELSK